jgi:hypothetical protein
MSKLNEKEIAYKKGRDDERKKLIRKLESKATELTKDYESLEGAQLVAASAFTDYILKVLRELDAKL